MASDPAHRLLAAPELLELVLLQLDHRTLLCRALLVSRQWRDLIIASVKLQQKLFLRPIKARSDNLDQQTEQNALVWKDYLRSQDPFELAPSDQEQARAAEATGLTHPMNVWKLPTSANAPYAFLGTFDWWDTSSRFTRPEASWRRMLIQQPALTSLGLAVCKGNSDGTYITSVGTAHCPCGIRMGHLWDTMRQSMAKLTRSRCIMRLVWWKPSLTTFETSMYPLASHVARLFSEGADIVMAIGFNEPLLSGTSSEQYTYRVHGHDCPLDFKLTDLHNPPLR